MNNINNETPPVEPIHTRAERVLEKHRQEWVKAYETNPRITVTDNTGDRSWCRWGELATYDTG